jgi:hypothetical protein
VLIFYSSYRHIDAPGAERTDLLRFPGVWSLIIAIVGGMGYGKKCARRPDRLPA